MEPAPLSREARHTSWRVFALVFVSAAYFFQSSGHNEAARFDQMRSLTEHGEWWIDRFAGNTADSVQVGEHTYPNKAPGTTLLGLVPWRVARAVMGALPIDSAKQLILVTYALTLLMSALPTALTSLMMLRFFSRSGWTLTLATLAALGYGLGTLAFPFATLFFGHQLAAFFAFGGFYLVWSSRWIEGRQRNARLAIAGLMIGFLPVIEYPGAIASGLIAVYAVAVVGVRSASFVLVGALVGVLPLAVYNQIAFGSPGVLSYSFHREGGTFPAHQQGLGGVSWPRLSVLREITYRPQRGLLWANPWLAFGLLTPYFFRRLTGLRQELVLCAVIVASFLAFNSGFGDSIVYWGGAFSFGPRHLLIALPFAALLAAVPLTSRRLGLSLGIAIVVTIFLMLPAAAIDPRLPYEPDEPFLGFYLPLFSRGLLATNPWPTFEQGVLFGSSGAWNLGRALGLPRDLEVLPLMLVWAIGATLLFKPQTPRARFAKALVAILAIAIGLVPAWKRLAPWNAEEAGLCQAVSRNQTWPYFSDWALQNEPSQTPVFRRVASPSIGAADDLGGPAADAESSVAVTFSGVLTPNTSGWHVLQLDTIGQAALYVDGLQRLKIDGPGQFPETKAAQVYLAQAPHELMVRYMSRQPARRLTVLVGLKETQLAPLRAGLSSGVCG